MSIFTGIKGLLTSKKATMSIMVLLCSTIGMLSGHMDGSAFAAVMSIVSSIFMWSHTKTDLASLSAGDKKNV